MPRTLPLLGLATLPLAGCAASPDAGPAPRPARVNHVVLITLEDPTRAGELIADCDRRLAAIPSVVSYYAGRHVDVGRAAVDDRYTVGLCVGFDDLDGYRAYLEHSDHVALVDDWRDDWSEIRIFDIEDPTP